MRCLLVGLTVLALWCSDSCSAVDAIDGDIEQPEHCCIKLTRGAVRACVASFVEPDHCMVWSCPTTDGAVCRDEQGTVIDPPEGWHP